MSLNPSASPTSVTLVDSCVLLDIFTKDPKWGKWSQDALAHASDGGIIVINQLIYAEISTRFPFIEDLDDTIADDVERENLPYEAAFLAGQAFKDYKRRGGLKRSPLPDFYIGGHAVVRSYRLLTRDVQRFRTYFPNLELVCPN